MAKPKAKPKAAPIANALLASALGGERDPVEPLAADQTRAFSAWVLGTSNVLTPRGRVVELACGHFTVTKALREAACPRCGEMIRSGWDHDGFRRLGNPDTIHWPDDPLHVLHEVVIDGAEFPRRYNPTNPC